MQGLSNFSSYDDPMAEPKTKLTTASVDTFLNAIKEDQVRTDCWTIVDIMQKATKAKPHMWGTNIVGFGTRKATYADGRQADWMMIAFAPRKQNITLYIASGFPEYEELRGQLGKHSGGKECVYVKRLSDIHLPSLKKLVTASIRHLKATGS
jgi:hypothetical protein